MRLALAALLALTSCTSRSPIPAPRTPLAATPASALAGPPTDARPSALPRIEPIEHRLENGLRIILVPGRANGLVSIVFASRATPLWDAEAPPLVTRWMVTSVFRATSTEDGVRDDLMEREGFSPSVGVGAAGLLVSDRMPGEELGRYLRTLELVLRAPAFRPADLAHGVANQIDRVEGALQGSAGMLADQLPRFLYAPGDPRAVPMSQELRVLPQLGVAPLRARHARLLDPSRSALVVTGDFDPVEVLSQIRAHFGAWPSRPANPRPANPSPAPVLYRREGTPRGVAVVRPTLRAYVQLVEHAPPFTHEDYPAFLVLEQLLGGMFGARLNLVIRENDGASYGFHAAYRADATEGILEMETSVDPRVASPVLAMILGEVRRVGGDGAGIEHRELVLAKTRAREALLAGVDESLGLALAIARRVQAERPPTDFLEVVRQIDALDAGAVSAAARRWLRPEAAPVLLIVRPEYVRSLSRSGAGPIEVVAGRDRVRR